jgi:hypothetical protein
MRDIRAQDDRNQVQLVRPEQRWNGLRFDNTTGFDPSFKRYCDGFRLFIAR